MQPLHCKEIHWIENKNGVSIPYDQGFALSSTRDPNREASQWVMQNLENFKWTDRWIIVGGGGGFHLEALNQQFPQTYAQKLFAIIDWRWKEISHSTNLDSAQIISDGNQLNHIQQQINTFPHLRWGIFEFKPAWQNRKVDFENSVIQLQSSFNLSYVNSFQDITFFENLSRELFH